MGSGRRLYKNTSWHIDWHFWFRVALVGRRCGEHTRWLMQSEGSCPKMRMGVQKQSSELRHDQGLSLLN